MFKKILDWRTKPVEELTEAELLKRGYKAVNDINKLIEEVQSLKQEFTGSEMNPESGFFHQFNNFKKQTEGDIKDMKKDIFEMKTFQSNQKTGFSLAKWLLGGGIGFAILGKFFNDIFK